MYNFICCKDNKTIQYNKTKIVKKNKSGTQYMYSTNVTHQAIWRHTFPRKS